MVLVVVMLVVGLVCANAQDEKPKRAYLSGVIKSVDQDASSMVVTKDGKQKADVTVNVADDTKLMMAQAEGKPSAITMEDIEAGLFVRVMGEMDGDEVNAKNVTVAKNKEDLKRKGGGKKAPKKEVEPEDDGDDADE